MSGLAWVLFIALIGWASFVALWDLDGGPVLEGTDCWVSQTARETLESGHWMTPTFSGGERYHKTPGAYWAVMLTSIIRHRPVDAAATRLPNAISAIIMAVVIFWLTRRIAGDAAAAFAGFAFVSSTFMFDWSHRGASDMGLAMLITVSLSALWVASAQEAPGWKRHALWLVGYFAAGLGMLYKGPMPLPCVGAPALVWVLLRQRWRVFASWWHLVGLLMFLLPWLPWVIAVLLQEPAALDRWKVEFVDRTTGALPNVEANKQWLFYFFYLVPPLVYTLPYSMSLPEAIARGFRRQGGVDRDGQTFMLIWFFSLLAFFTLATGKESRYFLSALPPLFVLLGVQLAILFDPKRSIPRGKVLSGVWAVWLGMPALFVAGVFGMMKFQEKLRPDLALYDVMLPYAITAALFCLGAMLSAWLYVRGRRYSSFAAVAAATVLTFTFGWSQLGTIVGDQPGEIEFAHKLQTKITQPGWRAAMFQVGHQNPTLIWHSDVRYPRIVDQFELLEMEGGERSLVREQQIIGEAMMNKLADRDKLTLLVIRREHLMMYMLEGPQMAEQLGIPFPEYYVWLTTSLGDPRKHTFLIGNQPPPWAEPTIQPPLLTDKIRLKYERRKQQASKRQGDS